MLKQNANLTVKLLNKLIRINTHNVIPVLCTTMKLYTITRNLLQKAAILKGNLSFHDKSYACFTLHSKHMLYNKNVDIKFTEHNAFLGLTNIRCSKSKDWKAK